MFLFDDFLKILQNRKSKNKWKIYSEVLKTHEKEKTNKHAKNNEKHTKNVKTKKNNETRKKLARRDVRSTLIRRALRLEACETCF